MAVTIRKADLEDVDAIAAFAAAVMLEHYTPILGRRAAQEDAGQFAASDIDVFMLALVGGRERTLIEYTQLLEASGWRLQRTVSTSSRDILEAAPA